MPDLSLKRPVYIDDSSALRRLVPRLRREPVVAMDTESNSLFAYRERLCLVQVSTAACNYLIDPLAGVDIALLAPLLADPNVVKVFHDAELDVVLLRRTQPLEIAALYDTQAAAAALGIRHLGLASLLKEFFGVALDKRWQCSDWGRRPLAAEQLTYAALDTHWLLPLAAELRRRLAAVDPVAELEVAAECQRLTRLQAVVRRADLDGFVRIRGTEALDGHGWRALRELWSMRERLAEQRDCPPFKVLSNEMLLHLALTRPRDRAALHAMAVVSIKLAQRFEAEILQALRDAAEQGPLHEVPRGVAADPLSSEQSAVFEALRVWRGRTARARPTQPALLLPRAAMLSLARLPSKPVTIAELQDTGILEPWRVQRYGAELVHVLTTTRNSPMPRSAL